MDRELHCLSDVDLELLNEVGLVQQFTQARLISIVHFDQRIAARTGGSRGIQIVRTRHDRGYAIITTT
jgi:hypothetical protein